MSFETAFGQARGSLLAALVGSAGDSAREGGGGLAARLTLTVIVLGLTGGFWAMARGTGVIGTGALFFPACLVVTLFAGWEFGAVVLIAAAALIWTVARSEAPGSALLLFGLAGVIELIVAGFVREVLRSAWHAESALRSLADRRAREAEAREMVLGEARHRLKNLMAIIEALAKFSGGRKGETPDVDRYLGRFLGRLRALGAASDLALSHGFDALEAGAVVRTVLTPFLAGQPARLRVEGPELRLSEPFAGALALAVHELATNALKYGALSRASGRVDLSWSTAREAAGTRIAFVWSEHGGPPPVPPARDGFGHRLVRASASSEPEGAVAIDYPPEGLVCRISCLARAATPASPRSGR